MLSGAFSLHLCFECGKKFEEDVAEICVVGLTLPIATSSCPGVPGAPSVPSQPLQDHIIQTLSRSEGLSFEDLRKMLCWMFCGISQKAQEIACVSWSSFAWQCTEVSRSSPASLNLSSVGAQDLSRTGSCPKHQLWGQEEAFGWARNEN